MSSGYESADDDQRAEELVRLASADNFRDVAGTGPGYVTRHGSRVRRGVFFRSNELQLTEADAAEIAALGVTALHDLRNAQEIAHHPDAPVPGASWHHFEILGIPMDEVVGLQDRAAAVEVMGRVYRGFVEHPGARAAFGALLTRLAEDQGTQLFHCTAGKDRTGWAAALLLHVAGVEDDVIMTDYLMTNDYAESSRAAHLAQVESGLGPDMVEVFERVLVADADYLAMAYATVETSFGSLDSYLTEGLGLGRETLEALDAKLHA